MKDIKKYITEGFFSNVGADNHVKVAIDFIKEINEKDRCYDVAHVITYTNKLTDIFKCIEKDLSKGRFVFTYTRNDGTCADKKVEVNLTVFRSYPRWQYESGGGTHGWDAEAMAQAILGDLYYAVKYPTRDKSLHHSIAKTIKVEEFKVLK